MPGALDILYAWCTKWKPNIAIENCEVLTVGISNPCTSYNINGISIPYEEDVVDLGVTVDIINEN